MMKGALYLALGLYLALPMVNVDAQITGLSVAFNPLLALGLGAAGLALAGAAGGRNRGRSRSSYRRSYSRGYNRGYRHGRSVDDEEESVNNLILQGNFPVPHICVLKNTDLWFQCVF